MNKEALCRIDGCSREASRVYDGTCRSCYRRFCRNGSYEYTSTSHGKFKIMNTGLQPAYNMMHQRCENPNNKSYPDYGGRGISVCDRWSGVNGIVNFLEDMGPRPEGYSIDRIDNDGNYTPENCRWADKHTQVSNRSNTSKIHVGVVAVKGRRLFESSIIMNKVRYRKFFTDKDDAIRYRKEMEKKHGVNKIPR